MSLWGLFGSPPENQCTKDMISSQKQSRNDMDRDIMSANIMTSDVAAFAQQAGKRSSITTDYQMDISDEAQERAVDQVKHYLKEKVECELNKLIKSKGDEMQQGYFDQCNDIISNLEETLSALQLTVSDLHAWAFGRPLTGDGDPAGVSAQRPVQSQAMQNRLIDALEHATAILSDANEVQIFMMGGEYEGAPDDWVDDLHQSAQASPVKQGKPETIEASEVARNILGGDNRSSVDQPLIDGEACFIVDITRPLPESVMSACWRNDDGFMHLMRSGLIFKARHKEAAIAHAKALIAVSKGE